MIDNYLFYRNILIIQLSICDRTEQNRTEFNLKNSYNSHRDICIISVINLRKYTPVTYIKVNNIIHTHSKLIKRFTYDIYVFR